MEKMSCKNNIVIEDEDDDLEALRQAALATLKSRSNSTLEHGMSSSITTKIDTSILANNECRRSNSQMNRGRGRGRPFSKGNQRSNLIVITPVNINKEEDASTKILLPQNNWCHSLTEDSNVQTFRKKGPTRFNRFESDSESSDSDFGNSDDDSYSNDTILQDERLSFEDSCSTKDFVDKDKIHTVNSQEDSNLSNEALFEKEDSPCLQNTKPSSATTVMSNSIKESFQTDMFADTESKSDIKSSLKSEQPLKTESFQNKSEPTTFNGKINKENSLVISPSDEKIQSSSSCKHSNVSQEENCQNTKESSSINNKLGRNDLRLQLKRRLEGQKTTKSENSQDSLKHNREHHRSVRNSKDRSRKHKHNSKHSRSRSRSSSPRQYNSHSSRNDKRKHYSRERQNTGRGKVTERENKNSNGRKVSPSHESKDGSSESRLSRKSSPISSSSADSSPQRPAVSSVVKPMFITWKSDSDKRSSLKQTDGETRRTKNETSKETRFVPLSSSIQGGENLSKGAELNKRVPVHMRLGALPSKRVIQRTKDVEAAFVNSSSEEDDLSVTCKKDSLRVVTEVHRSKSSHQQDKSYQKITFGGEKAKRLKINR